MSYLLCAGVCFCLCGLTVTTASYASVGGSQCLSTSFLASVGVSVGTDILGCSPLIFLEVWSTENYQQLGCPGTGMIALVGNRSGERAFGLRASSWLLSRADRSGVLAERLCITARQRPEHPSPPSDSPPLRIPPAAWSGTNDAEDCCLSVTKLIIPRHIVCAYRRLSPENGCRLSAVVFTTQKGHQLCAPPNRPWVKRLIKKLDNPQPQLQLV